MKEGQGAGMRWEPERRPQNGRDYTEGPCWLIVWMVPPSPAAVMSFPVTEAGQPQADSLKIGPAAE